ncbi:MAG: hypothetical protein ABW025_07435 [Cellulomonas sp.]
MRRRTVTGALIAGVLVVGVHVVADEATRYPVVPEVGPWTIVVQPTDRDLDACWADPAILLAVTPAILPPAATGVTLVDGATRADAQRVVGCLVAAAGPAEVDVRAAAG